MPGSTLPSETIGELSASFIMALRERHPDLKLEDVMVNWNEILRSLPMAATIHDAVDGAVKQAMERIAQKYGS